MRVLTAVVLAMVAASAGEETTLGAGVSMQTATPIAAIAGTPEKFVGRTVRVDGIATAVCTHMGCWMAVAAEDKREGPTVRLKVEDGVIVFPVSAKGRRVSAQGVLEPVGSDAHGKEAADEHGKHDSKAATEYHIKATGAIIR